METNVLKDFRDQHGLTQGDLGVALGIDPDKAQSRISHYESRRREIPIDIAYAFIDLAKSRGDDFSLEDVYSRRMFGAA